jgi:hypothetical protein
MESPPSNQLSYKRVFQSLKHNILKTKKVECKGLDGGGARSQHTWKLTTESYTLKSGDEGGSP